MRNVLYVIIALVVVFAMQSGLQADSLDGYSAPELEKSSMPVKEYIVVIGTAIGIALVAVKNPRRTHVSSD